MGDAWRYLIGVLFVVGLVWAFSNSSSNEELRDPQSAATQPRPGRETLWFVSIVIAIVIAMAMLSQ